MALAIPLRGLGLNLAVTQVTSEATDMNIFSSIFGKPPQRPPLNVWPNNSTWGALKNGENLILFHSGWGDGVYPVIGSFNSIGHLLAAHIDFLVLK